MTTRRAGPASQEKTCHHIKNIYKVKKLAVSYATCRNQILNVLKVIPLALHFKTYLIKPRETATLLFYVCTPRSREGK